ncbi:MAG: ParB/RepB/Spo0J family partition protein [Caldilineaceae bacterium]
MVATTEGTRWLARQTFEQAHRRGQWGQIIARLFQRQITLLGLDEVRHNVRITNSTDRGIRDISLDAIAGSVSRTRDYTANFLPLKEHLIERWSGILLAMEQMESLPPIEVYKLDDRYYVIDGHHRVSVAKWLGLKEITAHVIEIRTENRGRAEPTMANTPTCWQAAGC